jgi:pimeloyl-ACP methyl ester carboxylesterase
MCFQKTLRQGLFFAAYGFSGLALGLLAALLIFLDSRPDLSIWHMAELDEEYSVDTGVADFEGYLALESRLFEQLDEVVYKAMPAGDDQSIERYRRGSLSDPQRWSPNWNRSFELATDSPKAAILLLHGMSDSPYSLRHLGEALHGAGAYVVGLRFPGHGTVPSGLVNLTWQDMDAAMRLAVSHLAAKAPGQPIYLVGYSTGGALAVHYALATLDDPNLPRVERIALLAPAIGITPVAALAVWQARLGSLPGLDKLAWNDILPEYDPFKYNSFAVNAGDVVYRLAAEIQRRLAQQAARTDGLDNMPPVLAFSSVVDGTVSPLALVKGFFERLPPGEHELVLFDINRRSRIEPILKWDQAVITEVLQSNNGRHYRLGLVTNETPDSGRVVLRKLLPGYQGAVDVQLDMEWPASLYSLGHLSLNFPAEDALYGFAPASQGAGIQLGALALRGETGVLRVDAGSMLRLRANPFYPFLQNYLLDFFHLAH